MGSLRINGQSYSGNNFRIKNGKVEIDGEELQTGFETQALKIEVHGNIETLETDLLTIVNGNVGNLYCKGSVRCEKVEGDIITRGSVDTEDT